MTFVNMMETWTRIVEPWVYMFSSSCSSFLVSFSSVRLFGHGNVFSTFLLFLSSFFFPSFFLLGVFICGIEWCSVPRTTTKTK